MKIFTLIFFACFAILAFVPVLPAYADITQDRAFAEQHASAKLQQHCLEDFARRSGERLTPAGKLSFNEDATRMVYRALYWDGADRGVAFVLPVKAGEMVANVACLYAVTEQGLEFQLSQQIMWRL
jgi:hypothetical protein